MEELYRIVVPILRTEGGERVFGYAMAIARAQSPAQLVTVDMVEVPPQTSLEAAASREEFVIAQETALELAQVRVRDLGMGPQTRAVDGHRWRRGLQPMIREERTDHIMVEWPDSRGQGRFRSPREVYGLFRGMEVEGMLVHMDGGGICNIAALVDGGPHAVPAARRAGLTRRLWGSLPATLRQRRSVAVAVVRNGFDHTRHLLDELAAQVWGS